jgi:hypothetical protein
VEVVVLLQLQVGPGGRVSEPNYSGQRPVITPPGRTPRFRIFQKVRHDDLTWEVSNHWWGEFGYFVYSLAGPDGNRHYNVPEKSIEPITAEFSWDQEAL